MHSLRPDELLLVALVDGDPRARAIAESWRFHEPVTLMPSAELDELSERCHTVFNGGQDYNLDGIASTWSTGLGSEDLASITGDLEESAHADR